MKFAPYPLLDIPEHTKKTYYTTEYGVFEELPTREEINMVRDLARSLAIYHSNVDPFAFIADALDDGDPRLSKDYKTSHPYWGN